MGPPFSLERVAQYSKLLYRHSRGTVNEILLYIL